jgi:hypothetical protein
LDLKDDLKMQELNRMIEAQEKRLQEREDRQKHNNASQTVQTIPVKPSTILRNTMIGIVTGLVLIIFVFYLIRLDAELTKKSDSDRKVDIAKLESMKEALDSDMNGIQTFQNDREEGKPISSDRYNWYLQIKREYDNGVSLYNQIAKKTESPMYTPQ